MADRSIQEAAREVGVPESKIRYWERTIPRLAFPRNRQGRRIFRDEDIETLKYIRFLREEKKVPLSRIPHLLEAMDHPYRIHYQLINELEGVRRFLEGLAQRLNA